MFLGLKIGKTMKHSIFNDFNKNIIPHPKYYMNSSPLPTFTVPSWIELWGSFFVLFCFFKKRGRRKTTIALVCWRYWFSEYIGHTVRKRGCKACWLEPSPSLPISWSQTWSWSCSLAPFVQLRPVSAKLCICTWRRPSSALFYLTAIDPPASI